MRQLQQLMKQQKASPIIQTPKSEIFLFKYNIAVTTVKTPNKAPMIPNMICNFFIVFFP